MEKLKFGMFGSLYLAGVVVGCAIMPRLGDTVGRKRIAVIGNILHLISACVILLSTSLHINFAM